MNAPLTDTMTRRADLMPESFDEKAGTVEAVISTFADVTRRDHRGAYIERLDPAGLDTSRLVGAPMLDGHRQGSARDTIGVVTGFRMDGNNLTATIRLSKANDIADIVTRISEGTLSGVSLGYRVGKWTDSIDPDSKMRVRTATAWTVFEISAVPIPADSGATFRGSNMTIENTETITPEQTPAVNDNSPLETRAAIRTIARTAGLPVEWADTQIDSDSTVIEARAAAFEEMQSRTTPNIRVVSSNDDPAIIRERRGEALFSRMNGVAPSDEARSYMNESLRDMARASVEATGVSTRSMDADTLFRAAMHTTSDFPQLLSGAGNRTLMSAYQAAQSPIKALARQTTLSDFRPATKLKLSDIGLLEKVSESGEITHTSRGEATESYALDTYATQFSISRKALINDDLGAFRDWGQTSGRMAAETEANLLVGLLQSNPVMGEDAKTLFHADHGNQAAAGAVVDITELDAARLAMRNMKALDGKTPINATPKFLVVGPALETKAEQVLAAIYAATVADANPFTGKLTLLVEPRITDGSWYIFADPAILPVLEYAYLSSAQGPQMASREGWDVLGMEFRVLLDFGSGAVDWRGAYFNAGV